MARFPLILIFCFRDMLVLFNTFLSDSPQTVLSKMSCSNGQIWEIIRDKLKFYNGFEFKY